MEIAKYKEEDYEKLRIATELWCSLGMGMGIGTGAKDAAVALIMDEACAGRSAYEARNDIYLKGIELCQNSDIPEAQWLVFDCYKALPAKYRDALMEQGYFLAKKGWDRTCGGGAYYLVAKGNEANRLSDNDGYRSVNYQLGGLLFAYNQLDEALEHVEIAYSKYPSSELCCRLLAETYVKMNDLDKALQILYAYRDTPHYLANKAYIDGAVRDVEDKKARGYVFRPRKKKSLT